MKTAGSSCLQFNLVEKPWMLMIWGGNKAVIYDMNMWHSFATSCVISLLACFPEMKSPV